MIICINVLRVFALLSDGRLLYRKQSSDEEFRRSSITSSQDGMDIENYMREMLKTYDEESQPPSLYQRASELWAQGTDKVKRLQEAILYNYYNWRQDTVSDLLLILTANTMLILTGSLVKMLVVDPFLAGEPDDPLTFIKPSVEGELTMFERFWPDVYR